MYSQTGTFDIFSNFFFFVAMRVGVITALTVKRKGTGIFLRAYKRTVTSKSKQHFHLMLLHLQQLTSSDPLTE